MMSADVLAGIPGFGPYDWEELLLFEWVPLPAIRWIIPVAEPIYTELPRSQKAICSPDRNEKSPKLPPKYADESSLPSMGSLDRSMEAGFVTPLRNSQRRSLRCTSRTYWEC